VFWQQKKRKALMNFFQKINAIWRNVSLTQRVLLTAIGLTFIIAGGFLIHWARKPDMGLLYSNLDREEAAKITEKIGEKGIVYTLANGGTTIYAPKENIAQLRLDMAKEGLPKDSQKGYGIFDNEKIGISPFVQNVNLKRALQEELAKSIQMIDGVSHARVHIVSTEQTIFTSEGTGTSASVVLQLKAGYRASSLNIAAITHLVASSVEGLSCENVTVVDSQGHLLSGESDQITAGGAGTVADYRERVEQNLADKVEGMLTAVLGPGRAKVEVSAEIDMTSSNTAKEIYDEGKKVPKKEEIKSESETESTKASAENEATGPESAKKGETIITEYAVPKTVQQTIELPGEIKTLTVAAFVDLSAPKKNETEEGKTEPAESEAAAKPIMTIADVEEIIKKALGPKLKNEDLKVVDVRFNRPEESLIGQEEPGGLDFVAIAKHSSLGIMAICALIVLKMFGKAKKKAGETAPAELPAGFGQTAGLLPAGAEGSESLMLRKQIANILRNNPEQAKQLFSSWLEEKGS
jgi:flagellar M-ring protein FliF